MERVGGVTYVHMRNGLAQNVLFTFNVDSSLSAVIVFNKICLMSTPVLLIG